LLGIWVGWNKQGSNRSSVSFGMMTP